MSITRRRLLEASALSLAGIGGACTKRGTGYAGYAFVANAGGNAVAVVDLTAFAVTRYIALGSPPSQVLCHAAHPHLLALTPATSTIHVIELKELRVTRQVKLPGPVDQMRLTPDPSASALLLLSKSGGANGEGRLWKTSPQTLGVDYAVRLSEPATHLDIANWTGLAAVGHGATGRVTVLELATGKIVGTWETGAPFSAMQFRSDGKQVWVAQPDRRMVTAVQALDGQMVVHLPVAVSADTLFTSPDGGSLFVTGRDADALVVVEPYPAQVASTLPMGPRPGPMAAAADPPYLFVASRVASQVSVLDMTLRKVIAVTTVGGHPGLIEITPDQQYALVLNYDSGDMAIIRTTGIHARRQKTAALFTIIPVGTHPVSAAVWGA